MSTNYYFISSPLHLLFSANLAIQNQGERNVAILVHNISSQANHVAKLLKSDQSIFSDYLTFEDGKLKNKLAERKRRLKLIADFVKENPPKRIYTGTDRRVEFQFSMYSARQINPSVKGIYLDEGTTTYLGHKNMDRFSHKWIDPFLKKLSYGLWWDSPLIIGQSKWIDEVYAAFPEYVHPLLRTKKLNAMVQSPFGSEPFKNFSQKLIASSDVDLEVLADANALILLTLECVYDNPEKHLTEIIEHVTKHIPIEQIAIKAHPRSKAVKRYQELFPQAIFVNNQVGLEVLLPHLQSNTLFIGDISSTLFTIKWFNPKARLAAIELKQETAPQRLEKIKEFYKKIGVPGLNYSELAKKLD